MVTTYSDISYSSTTSTDTAPGRGLLVTETAFYVDNEDYYVDGSVVMRDVVNRTIIKCNDTNVLCNSRTVLCNNSDLIDEVSYG